MSNQSDKVFIQIAREGEVAGINGWYVPVNWRERSESFYKLHNALAASEKARSELVFELDQARVKLGKIEAIIGCVPF